MSADTESTARVPSGPSAGRPRSEEAHQAILDATLELLAEVGLSALTVEGVATRAGVGKATIYRRWKSKLPLVIEAYSQLPRLEEVDTGSLEGDLEAVLRHYLKLLGATTMGAVVPGLVGERAHNPEMARLLDPVIQARRQPLLRVLARGVERGELPAGIDLELAADFVMGPLVTRRFFTGAKINPKVVGPVVRAALHGLGSLRD